MKLREGNVFSRVCLSFCPRWSLYDHYPWCIGPHFTGTAYSWHRVAITGDLFKLVHWTSLYNLPTPPVLTSGGHWNTYGWQAGSAHPTAMLSCSLVYLIIAKFSLFLKIAFHWLNSQETRHLYIYPWPRGPCPLIHLDPPLKYSWNNISRSWGWQHCPLNALKQIYIFLSSV